MTRGLLALLIASLAGAQTAPTVVIAGRAVDAQSRAPLEHLYISIFNTAVRDREITHVTTPRDGAFRFEVPKGPSYLLYAEGSGISRQGYGTRDVGDGYAVAIVTAAALTYDQVEFAIHRPAVLTGRITDPFGEPVERALVQLLRVTSLGRQQSIPSRWAYTDDRGIYRLANLAPGSYGISVAGTPWYAKDDPSVTFQPVYYPNTRDARSAETIKLSSGETAPADFRLTEARGVPLTVRSTQSVENESVRIEAEGPFRVYQTLGFADYSGRSTFPPGRYRATLTGTINGQPVFAQQNVELSGAEGREVQLTPGPWPSVSGRATCDGHGFPADEPVSVVLSSTDANGSWTRRAGPDGTFVITGVKPGHYFLSLLLARTCTLSRVLLNGRPLPDRIIDVPLAGLDGVTVAGQSGAAKVHGLVKRGDVPAAGVYVLLAPVAVDADTVDYSSFKTDSDGSFQFRIVRPGEYYLYAVDQSNFSFADRAVIAPYLQHAEKIVVAPSSDLEKNIEVAALPQ